MPEDGVPPDQIPLILNPRAIAIVGASSDKSKRGHIAMRRLLKSEYTGSVYPVNPGVDDDILGEQVYPTVSAIPDTVDLVYIVTPPPVVADVLEDAGKAGVAGAVIFTAGFSEAGNTEEEQRLVDIAREYGIRFIGPNVMGLVNVPADLYLGIDADYEPGGLSMISQSGNLGMTLGHATNQAVNTGLSHFISIGNESDLTFQDFLPYFQTNDETDAVVLYTEGMAAGRDFLATAKPVTQHKPIIALRGGRTAIGKSTAASHTASLAGDTDVTDCLYSQAGVITVESFDDIIPVAQALTELPSMDGPNIGVMTEAGGVATIVADALIEDGLVVPDFSEDTQTALADLFPNSPNVSNPVDTMVSGATAGKHADAAELILSDPNIDGLLIAGAYGGYGVDGLGIELPTDDNSRRAQLESARRLTELPSEYDKPVVVKSAFHPTTTDALTICREGDIPVYTDFRHVPVAFDALWTYGDYLGAADQITDFDVDTHQDHNIVTTALEQGRATLSEHEARTLLADYDVPVAPSELVTDPGAAVAAADQFDESVAMKIVSPDIQHKTEVGGVALDITGREAVRDTYLDLVDNAKTAYPDATIDGVLISPMLQEGLEVIVGATHDEEVGPVLLFGIGGIFVEVIDDVAFSAVPVTEYDARSMVEDIAAAELLTGARGREEVDRQAIVDLIQQISDVVVANPSISDIDLNPVFCYEDDIAIVDAAIHLS